MIKRLKKSKSTQPTQNLKYLNRKPWTESEDQKLESAINLLGTRWRRVAIQVTGRNPSQCAQRWQRIKPESLSRNSRWTQEEDEKLISLYSELQFQWKNIASHFNNRNQKQVRERYVNHLDPQLNKDKWTQQEDEAIWKIFKEQGTKWSIMANLLPGRSQNMVKNRFYSFVRKTYGSIINPYYVVPNNVSCCDSFDTDKKQYPSQQTRSNDQSDLQYISTSQDIFNVSQTNSSFNLKNLESNSSLNLSNIEPIISSVNEDLQHSKDKDSEFDQYFQLSYQFHCGFDSYSEL